MTFAEMQKKIMSGEVFVRPTWDRHFFVALDNDRVLRLRDVRDPSFKPEWRASGYDANASDYVSLGLVVSDKETLWMLRAAMATERVSICNSCNGVTDAKTKNVLWNFKERDFRSKTP